MIRRVMFAVVLICCVVSAACADDASRSPAPTPAVSVGEWRMLGHDQASSFHSRSDTAIGISNVASLAPAWTIETAGSVTGTPAVVSGTAYVLSGGALSALSAHDGAVIWQNTAIRGTSSPSYDDGKLYVNDSGSVLHRVDAATGAEDWQAEIDPHARAAGFSSPVVAGRLIIVGSASTEEVTARDNATFRGSLVAFDRQSGVEVWRHYTADPPYNGVSIWSSPSVDLEAALVFASTGNNYTGEAGPTSDSIFAVDLETGALRWSRQLSGGDVFTIPNPQSEDSDFGTNPILFEAPIDGEQRELVGAGQKSGTFWALDRMTGEVVWSRKVSAGSALIGGIFNNGAWDGERLYVAGNNGTSTAPGSEPANGKSRPLGAARTTTSVLMALDPATGATVWERQLPAWVWAPITLANGLGWVPSDSEIQAFQTSTGNVMFRLDTDGTIASGAAISGGRVYFGSGLGYLGTTFDNAFYALGLPAAP